MGLGSALIRKPLRVFAMQATAILNPNSPGGDIRAADLQSAGRALGLQVQIVLARNAQEMMPRLTGLCKKTVR